MCVLFSADFIQQLAPFPVEPNQSALAGLHNEETTLVLVSILG